MTGYRSLSLRAVERIESPRSLDKSRGFVLDNPKAIKHDSD